MHETTDQRTATLARMRELVDGCRLSQRLAALAQDGRAPERGTELPNTESVISLDRRCSVDVLLEMNGPTTWVRFSFYPDGEYASASYHSTAYTESGAVVDVDLTDSEAEMLADVLTGSLDSLGQYAAGLEG